MGNIDKVAAEIILLNHVSKHFTATNSYVNTKFKVEVDEDDSGYAFFKSTWFSLYIHR